MEKYDPLTRWLERQTSDRVELTFDEAAISEKRFRS